MSSWDICFSLRSGEIKQLRSELKIKLNRLKFYHFSVFNLLNDKFL